MKLNIIWSVLRSLTPTQRRPQTQASTVQVSPQRPPDDDEEAWRKYWEERGQHWRTEPEITRERQNQLAQCLANKQKITERGFDRYPFKGMKLNRADIEWLLSNHDDGNGPIDCENEIDWSNEYGHDFQGLDLRGADVSNVNLSNLPLACTLAGCQWDEWLDTDWLEAAGVGDFRKGAGANFKNSIFWGTHLEGSNLLFSQFDEANLIGVHLDGADASFASFQRANLMDATMKNAQLFSTHMEVAALDRADMQGARLNGAYLNKAFLSETNLKQAKLDNANLEGAKLTGAKLGGASLCNAFFDSATELDGVELSCKEYGTAELRDVHWNDVNLFVVNWSAVKELGDEQRARSRKGTDGWWEGIVKNHAVRLGEYEGAVRANYILANALRSQGINEDGSRFAYRAQVLQQQVLWYQFTQPHIKTKKDELDEFFSSPPIENITLKQRLSFFFAWLYSLLLFLLSGYGYRIHRSFLTYAVVIGLFTVLYHLLVPGLAWQVALEVSLNACLSRGIPPSAFQAGDLASLISDFEAFIGLVIEVVFIATLTQRFFNK